MRICGLTEYDALKCALDLRPVQYKYIGVTSSPYTDHGDYQPRLDRRYEQHTFLLLLGPDNDADGVEGWFKGWFYLPQADPQVRSSWCWNAERCDPLEVIALMSAN